MKIKTFYTKYALKYFRIISIICVLFLIVTEISELPKLLPLHEKDYYYLFTRLVNFIAIVFFIFVVILPQKIENLSIITYIYSLAIIPFEPENYMGILMFFLGTSLLQARGFLKKQRKLKILCLYIVLLGLNLTHLRFGIYNFIDFFIKTIGCILVLLLYTFFIHGYSTNLLTYEDKKLNLASYPKLTERDCRILQRIQKGEKYSVIARDENITEGSLKNRLHFVFSTMEVGDKQGFLSYYDDYELFFESEDVKLPESQEELQ